MSEKIFGKERIITLRDGEGEELRTQTFRVGSLAEIYAHIQTESEEKTDAPQGAQSLISVFAKYRDETRRAIPLHNGSEIEKGAHLLIAGGFVRDVVMQQVPRDIDFTTDLSVENLLEFLRRHRDELPEVKWINVHGKTSPVVRIKFVNGEEYEFSTFKSANKGVNRITPRMDASTRDLTINAVLYDPLEGNIVDFAGGIEDIRNHTLRFTGNPYARISEDPMRMLRFVRFVAKTGFTPHPDSIEAIRLSVRLLETVTTDQIKQEIDKIAQVASAKQIMELFTQMRIMEILLPDVAQLKNCLQGPPYHYEGDVYVHTEMVADGIPVNAHPNLKWAAIFHDLGKTDTRTTKMQDDGTEKVSFHGHAEISRDKVKDIGENLRFSNDDIAEIMWLVENHMTLMQKVINRVQEASEKDREKMKHRAKIDMKKMIEEKGVDMISDLITLTNADNAGKRLQDGLSHHEESMRIMYEIFDLAMEEIDAEKENGIEWKKMVNGKVIMHICDVPEGPQIGKIRKKVLEYIAHDEQSTTIMTKESAESYIASILQQIKEKM